MSKLIKFFIAVLTVLSTVSCGEGVSSQNKGPTKIDLSTVNVLDYIHMDISYDVEGKDIIITTKAASDAYSFSRYPGFYMYLSCDTIFDYETRKNSYKVYVSLNSDGTSEIDDNLNKNAMAMVFTKAEVYGQACGDVTINGPVGNVKNGYVFSSNDEQQELYDSYVANIPKPGDETYGSDGNLYRYNDYTNKTGLALYSVNGGDVICASRSFKHNNDKVTEIGDGSAICYSHTGGSYQNCNKTITSIVLSKYTEKINEDAFSFASKLRTIEFPSTLKEIAKTAFWNASLADGISLPSGLEVIGEYAFQSTDLKVIFIPSSVHTMGKFVFENCENLVIYCEASSKPSGWHAGWDVKEQKGSMYYRHTVVWGASRSDAR